MLTEYVTSGSVSSGRLLIRNLTQMERALARFRDGEVRISIERRHANRSQAQNRYWWGVCVELVSEHTGYTSDEVHELAKQMFLPKKLALCDGNGEVKGEFVVGGTTTTLNKIEFGEFVESFRRWAAETLDVMIPDPDQDLVS
jgi:hypothetical protein